MSNKPYFSVVIPTYNCADLLNRAIDSVLAQTFQDFEIIVVDNSSTDDTDVILNSYSENRLRVLKVENKGIIAHSRNIGINNAQGRWIAFLDSDDVWKSEKLEKVKKNINQNAHAILFCHHEYLIHEGILVKQLIYGPFGPLTYDDLLFKRNCISTSAVCLRSDIAKTSGGFSEESDFVTAEDYEYWIRLSQLREFIIINEVLGECHSHDRNTSSNAIVHTKALIAVKKHHYNLWLSKYPNGQKRVKYGLGIVYLDASRILHKAGLFLNAIKFQIKAISLNPIQIRAWVFLLLSVLKIKNR